MKNEYRKREILQEVYILKRIKHPHIIRLLEVFETKKRILLVME